MDRGTRLAAAVWAALFAACAAVASNYDRPNMPDGGYAFLELPVGAVTPQGWLRDWCMAARDGLVGHIDENPDPRASVFRNGWLTSTAAVGSLDWQMERGYWTDALTRLGHVLNDTFLINKALVRLDFVKARVYCACSSRGEGSR